MELYHGSSKILPQPFYGGGNAANDFGSGFYCTEHEELAMEWACQEGCDGFVNRYRLNTDDLVIWRLNDQPDTMLVWITMLVTYRNPRISTPLMKRAKEWLIQRYAVDLTGIDVMIGYRADDSYFSFARAFLSNQISLEQLALAMKLGQLGEQIVLKSEKAYSGLSFDGFDSVDSGIWYPKRKHRDEDARDRYKKLIEKNEVGGHYILDLMREGEES